MSKEELLRIYSAYLPFGLECLIQGHHNQDGNPIKEKMLGIYDGTEVFTSLGLKDYQTNEIEDIFPILYSMDMLTQPIEHKGKTITPIVELAKIGTREESCGVTNSNLGTCYVDAKNQKKGFFIYHPNGYFMWQVGKNAEPLTVWNQLELFHKLFEWHFNVFNLPDSAYIKKENLKK